VCVCVWQMAPYFNKHFLVSLLQPIQHEQREVLVCLAFCMVTSL